MSDQLRPGIAVTPTFAEGEAPSPAKLNAISAQMKHAATQLEKAVGDIHGTAFPYSASSLTTLSPRYPTNRIGGDLSGTVEPRLDIANLARLVGPASNLNPRMFGTRTVQDTIPTGVYQFPLRYKPDDNTAVSFSDTGVFAVSFSNPVLMTTAGDYHVSTDGIVHTVSVTAGGTADYDYTPANTYGDMAAPNHSFNVIPHPSQIAAGGNGISWGGLSGSGTRTGTLPTATHQQSDYVGDSIVLANDDVNYAQQLEVPKVLQDNFTAGEKIPPGFLYVKNETTGEVYENAEYFYDTASTITIGLTDITSAINAGNKFSLITVGTDITSAIDDIRVKQHHTHDRSFGEPPVHIDSIVGIMEQAGNSGSFIPSEIPGNFAPQYLHRDGWTDGVDTNQNDENAMRGNIMLGSTASVPGDGQIDTGATSHKILFANVDRGIYSTANDFRIQTASTTGHSIVLGNSTSDGTATAGRVLLEVGVQGDSTRDESGLGTNWVGVARACKPLFAEGSFVDASLGTTIDLTTFGLNLTDEIYEAHLMVETGSNVYHPQHDGTASDFVISVTNDGISLNIIYTPSGGALTGTVSWRLTVWYREQ